jgi:hypothetical protein
MTNITHERIEPITFGGGGYGNKYRFQVTQGDLVTLSTCERDVAYSYTRAGLSVPAELQGPYDGYGNRLLQGEDT